MRTRAFILALLATGATAAPKMEVFGPFPHDAACTLTTIQKKGKITYEIYVETVRFAEFAQGSFQQATESAKSLHHSGVCLRVDWAQRSEL